MLFVLVFLGSEILNWSPGSTFGFIKVVTELSMQVTRAFLFNLHVLAFAQVLSYFESLKKSSHRKLMSELTHPHVVSNPDAALFDGF